MKSKEVKAAKKEKRVRKLGRAVISGNVKEACSMIKKEKRVRKLGRAVINGNVKKARSMIKKGANPDALMVDFFSAYPGETMLGIALIKKDLVMAQALLEEGADSNALDLWKRDALMAACAGGSAEGVRWALRFCKPSDPAAPAKLDRFGSNALMLAAEYINDAELVAQLIKGGDPNAVNSEGVTALMCAAEGKFELNLAALLPHSEARSVDQFKRSALHYACLLCEEKCEEDAIRCALLLSDRSDLEARDAFGDRAEALAVKSGYERLGSTLKGLRRAKAESGKIEKALKPAASTPLVKRQSVRL